VLALLILFHAKIVDVILSRKHYLMENMTISISPKYQLVFGSPVLSEKSCSKI